MEPMPMSEIDLVERRDEEELVKEWRTEQLRCLGVPTALAEKFGDRVDWREIAALVKRGCPPELALEIVR